MPSSTPFFSLSSPSIQAASDDGVYGYNTGGTTDGMPHSYEFAVSSGRVVVMQQYTALQPSSS